MTHQSFKTYAATLLSALHQSAFARCVVVRPLDFQGPPLISY